MNVVYVAGKFTGATQWAIAQNIRKAEEAGIEIARLGAMPLIPHANTANFHGELTTAFWYEGTLELLRRSDAVFLLPNWEVSKGARDEHKEAVRIGMPLFKNIQDLAGWLRRRA